MKKTHILATLLALLTLAGCEKVDDGVDGMVEIFAESMSGGKVLLNGANSTWVSGDQIRLNGTTATVTCLDDHAYISNAAMQSTNRALYPASLEVANWGTDNPVVTLPAYYHYRTDDSGHQLLDLPMAAYSNSTTTPLQFKHLTGALYVTVKNTGATPRTLQSVTVKSNKYALNGMLRVALNTTDLVTSTEGGESRRSVTLVFDEEVTLDNNESVRVMIPVRPVGSDNNFTIEVKSYASGQQSSYLSSKTQPSGSDHSLARNELGYAPMDIPVGETTVPVLTLNVNKYEIYTPFEFKLMTEAIRGNWFSNNSAKYYLMNDIDMTGIELIPIDNINFIGTIEGNNHTISNLTIKGVKVSDSVFCGLFLKSGFGVTFQNITFDSLRLINENVESSKLFVGAIEAYNSYTSEATKNFSNCTVNIRHFDDGGATGDVYFGGLIGCLEGEQAPISISNCHVLSRNLLFQGNNIWWGGLIGKITKGFTNIASSSWTGVGTTSIAANTTVRIGGLIGYKTLDRFWASDCSISGSLVASASYNYIGFLIGYYNAKPSATISNIDASAFSVTLNGSPITVNQFGN